MRLVLKPTADSNINAELWLPTQNWNGKFMAVGNGGFGGSIQGYGEMQNALRLGYATAGSDTGHSAADGPNGMFALGHPEKIVDFAYRAMHEMTATSKKLIDRYYGNAPQFSYYKGCSTGGRQGAMAAQRYPEDFDGIIAGALANRHIQMHTAGVYAQHPAGAASRGPHLRGQGADGEQGRDGQVRHAQGRLPQQPARLLVRLLDAGVQGRRRRHLPDAGAAQDRRAVLRRRQEQQGRADLLGPGARQPAAGAPGPSRRRLPAAATTPCASGASRTPTTTGRRSTSIATCRSSTARSASWTRSIRTCRKFKARGGKLLLYAGWGDTTITPENTVLYYENLKAKMGKNQDDWTRLFLVPGMAHCRGGDGPNTFDSIGTLEAWREKGVAPAQITAYNPQSSLSRPLCPYPQYAKYKGTGNFKDAANWSCVAP